MKILQINKLYYPDIGGVETVVQQYSEYLASFNNDVTVICIFKKRAAKTEINYINGVKIIRCSSFGMILSMPVSISFFWHIFLELFKTDIIHIHEPFPLASVFCSFLSKKRKLIVTWHSDIIKQKKVKKLVSFFQVKTLQRAKIITTTSPNMLLYSDTISNFKGKTRIIPLSIDIQKYLNFYAPSPFTEPYMLSMGRLSYYKGISFLLDSYKKSGVTMKLVIIGEGTESNYINEYLEKNKELNICFINKFLSEDQKKQYLVNCKFFLFPSIFTSEAFGITQLEAMIYGKPVINTKLKSGVPWVSINGETGLSCNVLDIDDLAKCIKRLIIDDDLCKELGYNAVQRVKDIFSDQKVLSKVIDLYNEIY